jgi:hypothetical protein
MDLLGGGKPLTLRGMLEGRTLNHSVMLHLFSNSPLRDADMNVMVLGRILEKAHNQKTSLYGTFVGLDPDMLTRNGARTAEQWIRAYSNKKGKSYIPDLLRFDPENPCRILLGEQLIRYLKETASRHGIELY